MLPRPPSSPARGPSAGGGRARLGRIAPGEAVVAFRNQARTATADAACLRRANGHHTGADQNFTATGARIDGSTVVVSSPAVSAPLYVRYGWSDNPDCNHFNTEGFPASPFRSGP